jgi:hypothetical protein
MSKKRKKASEHDAGGVVSVPVEADLTSPDLAGPPEEVPFGGKGPSTAALREPGDVPSGVPETPDDGGDLAELVQRLPEAGVRVLLEDEREHFLFERA